MSEQQRRTDEQTSAAAAMLQMIAGFGVSQAVRIAAELELADLMRVGRKTAEELAGPTDTHGPSLKRVMRALVSVGVFDEDGEGRFGLTPIGHTLRRDVPGSLRAWALIVLGHESRAAWGNLMHSVRTGEIAFDNVFGKDVWAYRAEHPATARIFDEAMGNLIKHYNSAVVATYPFATFDNVVDVGGGNGSFMISLLQTHPGMRGVLCDLPHVAEKARQKLAEAGLAERCEVVAGDAFKSVPAGGDAYVLSRVLHDWSDEAALGILKTCRNAMARDAILLVVERVLPNRVKHETSLQALCVSDLQMMVMNGGRERSEAEWGAVLAAAGFTLRRIVATESVMKVIEAGPA